MVCKRNPSPLWWNWQNKLPSQSHSNRNWDRKLACQITPLTFCFISLRSVLGFSLAGLPTLTREAPLKALRMADAESWSNIAAVLKLIL
jgi:hypothetical protein